MGGATQSSRTFITSTWMQSAREESEDDRSPSSVEKNGVATIYTGREPKPRISEN